MCVFFFKQKTAYEMRISDWSSDVCSSDLVSASMPGLSSQDGICCFSHKDTKPRRRRLGADGPLSPSTARLVARSQGKAASRPARPLRGFVSLCETEKAQH